MIFNYYDIECLASVFTLANFKELENTIDLFFLCEDEKLINTPDFVEKSEFTIRQKNKNFKNGQINLLNLKHENNVRYLAKTFGLSDATQINNRYNKSSYNPVYRLTCDTDLDFDEAKHPYFVGYNSYNYDTTMLAMLLYEMIEQKNNMEIIHTDTSTTLLRQYTDHLFLDEFRNAMPSRLTRQYNYFTRRWSKPDYRDPRWRIRKNMLLSGRHIDLSRMKTGIPTALKRQSGAFGHQIMESDKLGAHATIDTQDELIELFAYNVSDVIQLAKLATHPYYQSAIALKKNMLEDYPELIYEKHQTDYRANISPQTVKRNRLTIDSSSAQFAAQTLCPYGQLQDAPCVSFLYPAKEKAKQLGIKQINALDFILSFLHNNFQKDSKAIKAFMPIYNFYKQIEGKNFNDSEIYENYHKQKGTYVSVSDLKNIEKPNCFVHYYDKHDNETSTYVNFSTGGIHGAEYNKALYDKHYREYQAKCAQINEAKQQYPNATDLKKAKKITLSDGLTYETKHFITTNAKTREITHKTIKPPTLFKGTELNKKYRFTSAGEVTHADFKSYYPWLLILLMAFNNPELGEDRYEQIFNKKEYYGKQLKDKTLNPETRLDCKNKQIAVKLIANSASGAADAKHNTPIRANNAIIGMRIIGQLFTWLIGQAQTLAGSKVISTNTDGLYSITQDEKKNNDVLEEQGKIINITIEPEKLYLISKDANTRIEIDHKTNEVIKTNGATILFANGPDPTKTLDHAPILDYILLQYLKNSINNPRFLYESFNKELGFNILRKYMEENKNNLSQLLLMLQTPLSSSSEFSESQQHVFKTTDENDTPQIMQRFNRAYIVKEKTPNSCHVKKACLRTLSKATQESNNKKQLNDPNFTPDNEIALYILRQHNLEPTATKYAAVQIVKGIKPEWYLLIENQSVYELTEHEQKTILDNIDYDKYIELVTDIYEKNWMNTDAYN